MSCHVMTYICVRFLENSLHNKLIIYKNMINRADIILITGPSSSGKSTLANIICNHTNASKLNTKQLNIKSGQEFSKKYFAEELKQASELINKNLKSINDISIELKKIDSKILSKIWLEINEKRKKCKLTDFLDILYKNYDLEVNQIINSGGRCVIDHNIFLDPFPERKNIFLKYFAWPQSNFIVINLYSNLSNIVINTLERNQRFYNFINSQHPLSTNIEEKILKEDTKKGSSFNIFRQPLRTLENVASLYKFDQEKSSNALEFIPTKEFKKIIKLIFFEQVRLIGFLVFKKFPFTHIIDNELLQLHSSFKFLEEMSLSKSNIYIKFGRTFCNMQIKTNHNFSGEAVYDLINKSPQVTPQVNILDNYKNQLNKNTINRLFANTKKQQKFKLCHNIGDYKNIEKLHLFHYVKISMTKEIDLLVDDLMDKKTPVLAIYPICENQHTKILFTNMTNSSLTMKMEIKSRKKFHLFDNNLIFLAMLYAQLKIKGQLENLYFNYYFVDDLKI
ncbi:GspE family protein [Candidatus Bandiella numerosa]|uniref:hypothetical protein n=1 Tax=Candidatus Bandiella numerosa TaxID=2570586 RepID=UPI00249DC9A0|nr:hypothetical protein [Candidatus Bandiella numerosa]WHA04411.1 GspE family protein [Candidatus Bandiella numerosa]